MLIENTLFGIRDKVKIATQRLKHFEPKKGYYLAFSGGKDSVVIKHLAEKSGVKFSAHYNITQIDPPELVRFIRREHKDVISHHPEKSFWDELIYRGYPTRQFRWCCAILKEKCETSDMVITGIRKDESNERRNREMIEVCYKNEKKRYLNIIIDWSKADVWEYIHKNNIPYCKLYDKGWQRIGCLFCPNNYHRKKHAELYPKYVQTFIRAFNRRLEYAKKRGLTTAKRFKSGAEIWDFWINEKPKKKEHIDQTTIFE